MLRTLRIRELVIVEDLTLEFSPGLNLMTGETGAGKSIMVDALGLVAGQRGDRSLVRAGAERAIVEALFEVPVGSPAYEWAARRNLDGMLDGEQLLVRRELPTAGNGRIQINGSPSTQGLLRRWGERLLELHGQHEHQSLLRTERQLALLDRFAGHPERLRDVELAYEAVVEAREDLERLRRSAERSAARADELRRTANEIESLDPAPGELAGLDRERSLLRNSARVSELIEELVALTHDGQVNAADLAGTAVRRASELARIDPELEDAAARLQSVALELQDLGETFRDYRAGTRFDPGRLEQVEERRAGLERLCLRFGPNLQAVLDHLEQARAELASLGDLDSEIERGRERVGATESAYLDAAGSLGESRLAAARRLVPRIEKQFRSLALEKARFDVTLPPARGESVRAGDGRQAALHAGGAEGAAFLLAANPGEPFAPLNRAASGGELSRVMLALHAVAEDAGEGRALVFDEVDAGIGGKVADAVGARLADLARRQQVLCVTHLPQVAVYADRHLAVSKSVRSGRTRAVIRDLEGEARVAELARMLGGKRTTATSRRHASELLDAANRADRGRRP
jgi:DNA repair protein RecN (Recombination protein N)